MRSIYFAFCFNLFFSSTLFASNFCEVRSDIFFAKKILKESQNRLSFRNQGGIGGGGVCWWHSRFLRNATYLVDFKPELPKPNAKQLKKILKRIQKGKKVTIIPGFYNLKDFSATYQIEIQVLLDRWQLKDGLLKQKWITGLKGQAKVSPEKLQTMMNQLYEYVKLGNIAYQKLQIPGITAHAWLVIDMVKLTSGYKLSVIDSNYIYDVKTYYFRNGYTNFIYPYLGDFVPYTEKKNELSKLQKVLRKHCSNQ